MIGEEYPGQENRLRDMLASRLSIDRALILFMRIGKRSEAHKVAYTGQANQVIRYSMRDLHRIVAVL